MSIRRVSRFAVAGLLVAVTATLVVAQQTRKRAIEIELATTPKAVTTDSTAVAPMVPPMPPEMPGQRISVPALGPIGTAFDMAFPLNRNLTDNRQVFNFSVGVFGSDGDTTQVPPLPCLPSSFGSNFAPAAPVCPPACGVPCDPMKQMATQAFGQLLWQTGVTQPNVCLPPPAYCATTSVTFAAPPKSPLIGTWYREIGPMMCVIKIDADHITVSAYTVGNVDGKDGKQGAIVTADYHLMRDGTTMVGLITGLDVLFDGELSPAADALKFTEELGKMQKMFVDHPYSFSARVYDDSLMIGNVKVPRLSNQEDEIGQVLAGRYKSAGGKPVPTLKAIKVAKSKAATQSVLPPPPAVVPASATEPMLLPISPPVPQMVPPTMPN